MKNTRSTSATASRLRRRLTSTLLALGVFVGTIAFTARPAHAASNVYGCFVASQGMTIIGLPIQLQAFVNGSWVFMASNTNNGGNCIAFPIPTGYARTLYWRLVINTNYAGKHWFGTSPYWATPGDGFVNVGTGTVTMF